MSIELEYTTRRRELATGHVMDLRWAMPGPIGVLQVAIVLPVVQPRVIIAIDHDAASLSVEPFVVLPALVPRRVVLESNEHTLA